MINFKKGILMTIIFSRLLTALFSRSYFLCFFLFPIQKQERQAKNLAGLWFKSPVILIPIGQRPNTLLDSSKSVNTSPAATVYLCQRSSKLQDELFIQCARWETGSYNTYHFNKQ